MHDGFTAVEFHHILELDALLVARVFKQFAGLGTGFAHDDGFVLNLLERHRRFVGPRMVIPDHGDNRIGAVGNDMQALVRIDEGQNRDVDGEVVEPGQGFLF